MTARESTSVLTCVRLRLQRRRFRCDLHRIGDRTDLILKSSRAALIEHQGQMRLNRGLKSARLDLHLVGSDGQPGKGEQASVGCFC